MVENYPLCRIVGSMSYTRSNDYEPGQQQTADFAIAPSAEVFIKVGLLSTEGTVRTYQIAHTRRRRPGR